MPIFQFTKTEIKALDNTSFDLAGLQERRDLQRLLREHVEVIAADTLVIAEEFGQWDDSRRRIDLLAVDKDANLVVIELKRTDDGGHMELQGIRYAAMVSNITFDQATDVFAKHLRNLGKESLDARETLLDFLGWDAPDEDRFTQDVKIVLASADFSKEITSSVLWLIDHGIDIRCVRLKPYRMNDLLLVDVQQIIPLPEAIDYQIQVREKALKEREARVSGVDFTRFDVTFGNETIKSVWKRNALFFICKRLYESGVNPEEIAAIITWRNNAWFAVGGKVNEAEFKLRASEIADSGGLSFDPPRWFCDEGELFYANDKTYAFSKMWGGQNWHKAMGLLKEKYPQHQIDFSPTS